MKLFKHGFSPSDVAVVNAAMLVCADPKWSNIDGYIPNLPCSHASPPRVTMG